MTIPPWLLVIFFLELLISGWFFDIIMTVWTWRTFSFRSQAAGRWASNNWANFSRAIALQPWAIIPVLLTTRRPVFLWTCFFLGQIKKIQKVHDLGSKEHGTLGFLKGFYKDFPTRNTWMVKDMAHPDPVESQVEIWNVLVAMIFFYFLFKGFGGKYEFSHVFSSFLWCSLVFLVVLSYHFNFWVFCPHTHKVYVFLRDSIKYQLVGWSKTPMTVDQWIKGGYHTRRFSDIILLSWNQCCTRWTFGATHQLIVNSNLLWNSYPLKKRR